jgi:hypothetical protein
MEVPEIYRGMKKVKEYPNHVLYKDEYGRRVCNKGGRDGRN